jgi:hypothetical protein
MLVAGLLIIGTGCGRSERTKTAGHHRQRQTPKAAAPRAPITAEKNPTTLAGRGQPSLDDEFRPAAWIYMDDHGGTYIEREGNPQVQWIIEDPARPTPTFRIEAYQPLLGNPKDLNCVIDTVDSSDGSKVAYVISSKPGTFEVGRTYSLLRPGDDFIIRNRATGDVVSEIAPLAPGTYLIAAGLKNLETDKEALAITYFTVGEGTGK